ncbi:MAG: TA system VapC family ribonuclease toxin [Acidimicrobiales bacterium]
MTVLLDANVLISLVVADHVHHDSAEAWLSTSGDGFATCPSTQGSLLRLLIREGDSAASAQSVLEAVTRHARHVFWQDDLAYTKVFMGGIVGHRQVTDAYLAQLARHNQGTLATFDEGLVSLHNDVARLVPSLAQSG